jgi:hypothetical protein
MHDPERGCDLPNLAEFPLFLLNNQQAVHSEHATTMYEDVIQNPVTGRYIRRRFSMCWAAAGRAPTECDDEILQALISIARNENGFTERRLTVSRPEIFRMMGWSHNGRNLAKVEDAILLWEKVIFTYDSAWIDYGSGTVHNLRFAFLGGTDTQTDDDQHIRKFEIEWTGRIFEALQRGPYRDLDMKLYCRLRGVAKRMYRYIGRFGEATKPYQIYDLKDFASGAVGLTARTVDRIAELKRTLNKGFATLEAEGYIMPDLPDFRYRKKAAGKWDLHIRLAGESTDQPQLVDDDKVEALRRYGVTLAKARDLVQRFPDRIYPMIELMLAQKKPPRNRAGWLVRAIEQGYAPPEEVKALASPAPPRPVDPDLRALHFIDKLSEEERRRLQSEADVLYKDRIEEAATKSMESVRGTSIAATRKQALIDYVKNSKF